jgi:hypothetical protein
MRDTSPQSWSFIGHCYGSGPFVIDGIDVFKHEWCELPGRPMADVIDPLQ